MTTNKVCNCDTSVTPGMRLHEYGCPLWKEPSSAPQEPLESQKCTSYGCKNGVHLKSCPAYVPQEEPEAPSAIAGPEEWPYEHRRFEEGVRVFGPGMPTHGALIPNYPLAERIKRHDLAMFKAGQASSAKEAQELVEAGKNVLSVFTAPTLLNDFELREMKVKALTRLNAALAKFSSNTPRESGK